jgi:hypothetical protein
MKREVEAMENRVRLKYSKCCNGEDIGKLVPDTKYSRGIELNQNSGSLLAC